MINFSIQNFICFPILYLVLLKIEEYQIKGGIVMSRTQWCLLGIDSPMSFTCLLFVEKLAF